MNEATFTFLVDESLKSEFATAAKASDRTGAQLLRDFMREFVQQQQEAAEYDTWFRQKVRAGMDSAEPADWFRQMKSKPNSRLAVLLLAVGLIRPNNATVLDA